MAVADSMLQQHSTQHIPITTLDPLQAPPSDVAIQANVSLIWPYSSATHSAALLLVDPDFRLRSNGGQMRVQFHGPAAREVALSRIGIGDAVELRLEGAIWAATSPHSKTPGRCVAGELLFRRKLELRIQRDGTPFAEVNMDEPDSPAPQEISTPRRAPSTTLWRTPFGAAASREHKTPIRLGLEAHTSPLDPFADDNFELEERPRKRPRTSGLWRYERRSQTPPEVTSAVPVTEKPPDTMMEIPSTKITDGRATPSVLPQLDAEIIVPSPASAMSTARPRTPPSPYLKPVESAVLPIISPLASLKDAHEKLLKEATIADGLSTVNEESTRENAESIPAPRHSPTTQAIPPSEEQQQQSIEDHDPPDFGLDGAMMSRSAKTLEDESSPAIPCSRPGTPVCDDHRIIQDTYQSQADFSLRGSQSIPEPNNADLTVDATHQGSRRSRTPESVLGSSTELQKTPTAQPAPDGRKLEEPQIASSSPLPMLDRTPTPPTQSRCEEARPSPKRTVIVDLDSDDDEEEAPHDQNARANGETLQPASASAVGTSPNPAHPSNVFGSQLSASHGTFASSQMSNRSDWTDKTYVPNSESEGTDLDHPSTRTAVPNSDHAHSGAATAQAIDPIAHDQVHTPVAVSDPTSSPKPPSSAYSQLTSPIGPRKIARSEAAFDPKDADRRRAVDRPGDMSDTGDVPTSSPAPNNRRSPDNAQTLFEEVKARGSSKPDQQPHGPDVEERDAPSTSPAVPLNVEQPDQGAAHSPALTPPPPRSILETKPDESGIGVSQAAPRNDTVSLQQPLAAEPDADGFTKTSHPHEGHARARAQEPTPEASQTEPAQTKIQYSALPQHRVDQILDGRMPPTPAPSAIPAGMVEETVERAIPVEQKRDATPQADGNGSFLASAGRNDEDIVVVEQPAPNDQSSKTPLHKRVSEVPEAISTWFSSGIIPPPAKGRPLAKQRSSQPRVSLGPTAKIRAPSAGFTFGAATTATSAASDAQVSVSERKAPTITLPNVPSDTHILPHVLAKPHTASAANFQPLQNEGVRTQTSYYSPLSSLDGLLNRASQSPEATIDIIAIVSSPSSNPQRAKTGPRDYNTLLHVMDLSSPTVEVQVQIFRPFKLSLPIAETGDVILLRHFQVKSRLRRPFMLSGEGSAWHVWRHSRHKMQEDCRGPPVEIGDGEQQQAKKLRAWWVSIMNDANEDDTSPERHTSEGMDEGADSEPADGQAFDRADAHPAAAVPPVS